ncbi:EamA family transporter [Zavarzinia aquatilis]|uniref:EamA family transporter n=2 Tax=Zavarzinia aquatilis TaxID=2211142 RepID=A0A317EGY2_9PROT|nr:EamA family transporter [Zavarzinia aquatilis]
MRAAAAPMGELVPALVLLGITAVWGATFLIIQTALTDSGPLYFQTLRYVVATVCLVAVSGRHLLGVTRLELFVGLATGVAVAVANGMQAVALQWIPSSTSAFLTALYVPLVPIGQWLFMRERPGNVALVGIAMAFVGMALLAGPDALDVEAGRGQILTIASTFIIAFEIVAIGAYARRMDPRRVSAVQLVTVAVLTFGAMGVAGEGIPDHTPLLLACAGGLGVATVAIHVAMYWAQRRLSPTRATLIYAMEPVWAGLIGRAVGERLPLAGLVGAALIVGSIAINALRFRRRP